MKHEFELVGLVAIVVAAVAFSATDGSSIQFKQKEVGTAPSAATVQTSPRPAVAPSKPVEGEVIFEYDIDQDPKLAATIKEAKPEPGHFVIPGPLVDFLSQHGQDRGLNEDGGNDICCDIRCNADGSKCSMACHRC